MEKRPNILWICTDQQRFDTLGCYGNAFVQTPTLDKLAEDGMLFEQAYCQNPVCTPSRASFLTGRYPRTNRCRQNGQSIPADEVPVTRLLAEAGYVCGLSGKLHLSACHPSVAPVSERRINDGYTEFHWSHHPEPVQPSNNWPTNEYHQWLRERGMEYARTPYQGSRYVGTSMPEEFHHSTWCAEKAARFIEANAMFPSPWLFSVNFFDPHHPFDPPQNYLERYLERLDELPLPSYVEGELDAKPVFQRLDHQGAYGGRAGFRYSEMQPQDHRLLRAAYWAMVDLLDKQVGQMLEALRRTNQLENTLIIFMSDHGEMLGDHGLYLKGPHFYDCAVHVPLMISFPGMIASGQRHSELVELLDLAPTLLDAVGLPRYPGMQGRSLWPLLTGQTEHYQSRESVYSEFYNASFRYGDSDDRANATMLRNGSYKLVAQHGIVADQHTGELYDLAHDPDEVNNLWHDPDYQAVKITLLEQLCTRMAFTADPLPVRQADW